MRKRTYGQSSRARVRSAPPKKARYEAPRMNMLKKNTLSTASMYAKAIMSYADNKGLNPGAGTAAVQVYTANGLFDPDVTGVGHQPSGYDQYMALFNEYVVLGSTIKVSFSNSSTTAGVWVGISLVDFPATTIDPRRYIENGNTVWTTLGLFGSGADVKTLTHQADIQKFSTQSIFSEDSFSGVVGANPVDTHYYHIWVCAIDLAADPSATTINVEIKYDTRFRDKSLNDLS